MKLNKKIFTFVTICLCVLPLSVHAASYYGVITGAEVRIRKEKDSTAAYKFANSGETFDMPDNTLLAGNSDCQAGYYRVYYNNNIGYVCSNYLQVYEKATPTEDNKTATSECEKTLQAAGFPSSYWSGLCALKASHSNWKFTAVKDANGNAVDWNMSVASESGCGTNYISSSSNASYINKSCSKTGDAGYSPASEAAARYYMDPRNFFNEVNIFMFENQNVNSGISADAYRNATPYIFNNNYLVQQIPKIPDYIKTASASTGLSQIAIAARIRQELGNANLGYNYEFDNSALYSVVSGNYTSRTGYYYNAGAKAFVKNSAYASVDNYYNFFNVAAYDGSGVTQQALAYAYTHGWGGTGDKDADRQTAMTKGSKFIFDSYTNVGQNTIYFQKFNIYPTTTSSRYVHQYMTNIQAPVSESQIAYNAYKSANLLNSSFEFLIPVYSGMDNAPTTSGSGSASAAKGAVSTVVTGAGFRYNSNYISNIAPGTSVESLKNSLQSMGSTVTITDANGNAVSGNIGTGHRVTITGTTTETLIAVVYGDISGDGNINALDLLKVQKHILGTAILSGAYKEAADPSKDGNVNALDLLKVQKHILGSAMITQ